MSRSNKKTKIGETLRSQGLVMLPPLWIQATDMPQIHKIASKVTDHVNKVRKERRAHLEATSDPTKSREGAWEEYEKLRAMI
jgi:hypothetical protein